MNTPVYEQETIIRLNRAEPEAIIYTSDTVMMARLDKYAQQFEAWEKVSESRFKDGTIADKTFRCPADLVFLRKKSLKGRPMSGAQREALARLRSCSESADGADSFEDEEPYGDTSTV